MRKFSYYRVRVEHMHDIRRQMRVLMESVAQFQEKQGFQMNQVPDLVSQLQGVVRKIPFSVEKDDKLLHELEITVRQGMPKRSAHRAVAA